ncbi:hypothetical protein P8C59_002739 [Phyllachora maydis]|uniref:Ribosomal protein S6 n=1 Tax=Phyllachora maydis TaxID=1825666 RepID=A0AAD9HZ36_9PEZI|nr:hypothetical protein P8C59_002739 [Phyllachora maydis]
MLYEIIGIVRPGDLAIVKEIVLAAGQQILRSGGVIRDLRNWGTFYLPRPITAHKRRDVKGHYFALRFDAGVPAQEAVRRKIVADPRVLRVACVKLGDGKLDTLSRLTSLEWGRMDM